MTNTDRVWCDECDNEILQVDGFTTSDTGTYDMIICLACYDELEAPND